MIARVLPPDEWSRLADTPAGAYVAGLSPETATILVVERAGRIVAHHIVLPVLHVEGLWRADDASDPAIVRALWRGVQAEARRRGVRSIWTAATDDRVRRLIGYVGGTRLEGDHYLIPVKESAPCLPQ